MLSCAAKILRLKNDCRGTIISIELIMLAGIALIGLIVAVVATRDSLISELSDVSGAIQDSNQSYSYNSILTPSAEIAGSDHDDNLDAGDSNDDIAGQADNCVTFDGHPQSEFNQVVSQDNLVLNFDFSDGATDDSPFGNDNSGTLANGASVSNSVLFLDGQNDHVRIQNSSDINLQTVRERTIVVEFTPNDVNRRQVIYEEGGTLRGMNIYIDSGMLYVGAYNLDGASFQTFLSTAINVGERVTATLTLNGNNSIQSDVVAGFVNGIQFGSGNGGQVNRHSGAIRLGGIGGGTVMHDGPRRSNRMNSHFGGQINNLSIYNRALSDAEISILSQN